MGDDHTLKILVALVWYVGGIVLLVKGSSLLLEAELILPDKHWPWTAAIVALLVGGCQRLADLGQQLFGQFDLPPVLSVRTRLKDRDGVPFVSVSSSAVDPDLVRRVVRVVDGTIHADGLESIVACRPNRGQPRR